VFNDLFVNVNGGKGCSFDVFHIEQCSVEDQNRSEVFVSTARVEESFSEKVFHFRDVDRKEGLSELKMAVHGLKSVLGFIAVGLKEKKKALIVEVLLIILDLVLGNIFIELMRFFPFILIMLNLSVIEEPASLLALFCFLLFLIREEEVGLII